MMNAYRKMCLLIGHIARLIITIFQACHYCYSPGGYVTRRYDATAAANTVTTKQSGNDRRSVERPAYARYDAATATAATKQHIWPWLPTRPPHTDVHKRLCCICHNGRRRDGIHGWNDIKSLNDFFFATTQTFFVTKHCIEMLLKLYISVEIANSIVQRNTKLFLYK